MREKEERINWQVKKECKYANAKQKLKKNFINKSESEFSPRTRVKSNIKSIGYFLLW